MTVARKAVSYEEFGRLFMEAAVTPARVESSVRAMAGDRLELGPLEVGPGGVARASVTGTIGQITAAREDDESGLLGYRVTIAITLDLEVILAERKHNFRADVSVPLRLAVLTAVPLALLVEATAPRSRDVRVKVHAQGVQAKLLGRVGNIDVQICQQAASYVRDRLEHPDAQQAMTIELADLIDGAWPT